LAKPQLDRLFASDKARTLKEWHREFKATKLAEWLEAITKANDTITPMSEIATLATYLREQRRSGGTRGRFARKLADGVQRLRGANSTMA
jgi:LPS sulfotransferase NodH